MPIVIAPSFKRISPSSDSSVITLGAAWSPIFITLSRGMLNNLHSGALPEGGQGHSSALGKVGKSFQFFDGSVWVLGPYAIGLDGAYFCYASVNVSDFMFRYSCHVVESPFSIRVSR